MNESVDLHNLDEGARALVQRLLSELKHKQALLDKLTYEMALLKRLKFAAKSEALSADQSTLFADALEEDLQAVHEEAEQMQCAAPTGQAPATARTTAAPAV